MQEGGGSDNIFVHVLLFLCVCVFFLVNVYFTEGRTDLPRVSFGPVPDF